MRISLSTILTILALLIALACSAASYAPGGEATRDRNVIICLVIAVIFTLPRVASLLVPIEKRSRQTSLKHAQDDPDNPYRSPEN